MKKTSRPFPAKNRREQGSSLVEFLILTPVVMMMIYFAYDLNNRAEEMSVVTILSRNLAYRPQGERPETMREMVAFPFKAKDMQLGKAVRDAFESYETAGSIAPEYMIHHEVLDSLSYDNGADRGITRGRLTTPGSTQNTDDTGAASYSSIQKITDGILQANAAVDSTLDTLRDLHLTTEDGLRMGEASILVPGKDNDLQSDLSLLSHLVSEGSGDAVLQNPRTFSDRYFLRPEAGYHTNHYDSGALAGAFVGFVSEGQWDGYSEECMNKFNATEKCKPTNLFAYIVGGVGTAKSVAMCIADFYQGGGASFVQMQAQQTFQMAMNEAISAAVSDIVDSFVKKLFSKLTTTLKSGVEGEIKKVSDSVSSVVASGGESLGDMKGVNHLGK